MEREIPELLQNVCEKNRNSFSVKIVDITKDIDSSFPNYNINLEFLRDLVNMTGLQKISIDEHIYDIREFKLDNIKRKITLKIEMVRAPF